MIISPEPTSLTDAYALIKVLARQFRERRFKVLVNQAKSPREASEVFGKLDVAVDRFLHVSVELVGAIPYDDYIHMAVMQQKAVSDMFPEAPAAQAFKRLAQQVAQWPKPRLPKALYNSFGNDQPRMLVAENKLEWNKHEKDCRIARA